MWCSCKHRFTSVIVMTVMLASPAIAAELERRTLFRAAWPEVKNSSSILKLPAVKSVLRLFDENMEHRVIIRYPGGDAGNAWAFELRDWFVAFGVPSANQVLLPGSGYANAIVVTVETPE